MIEMITSDPEGKKALAAQHPWNALGRPEDVADAALFLASDEAAWITGYVSSVPGIRGARVRRADCFGL